MRIIVTLLECKVERDQTDQVIAREVGKPLSHLIDILSQNARNYKKRKKERKKERRGRRRKRKLQKKTHTKKTTSFFFTNGWQLLCPPESLSVHFYPSVQLIKAHLFINYCEASSVTTVCFRVSCLAMLL